MADNYGDVGEAYMRLGDNPSDFISYRNKMLGFRPSSGGNFASLAAATLYNKAAMAMGTPAMPGYLNRMNSVADDLGVHQARMLATRSAIHQFEQMQQNAHDMRMQSMRNQADIQRQQIASGRLPYAGGNPGTAPAQTEPTPPVNDMQTGAMRNQQDMIRPPPSTGNDTITADIMNAGNERQRPDYIDYAQPFNDAWTSFGKTPYGQAYSSAPAYTRMSNVPPAPPLLANPNSSAQQTYGQRLRSLWGAE